RAKIMGKLYGISADAAARAIDYTTTDFTKSGETYDVILDVIGKSPLAGSLKALNPNGRFMCANPSFSQMLRGTRTLGPSGQTVRKLQICCSSPDSSKRGRSNRSSRNAFRWNKPPMPTALWRPDTNRAISSSRCEASTKTCLLGSFCPVIKRKNEVAYRFTG